MPHVLPDSLRQLDRRFTEMTGLDAIWQGILKNRALIVYLAVVGLLSFTYDLFNFSLNIDSEIHAEGFGPNNGWVMQGRWGMYFLSWLMLPDTVMPFTPMLIAMTGSAVGMFFFLHTLSATRSTADYLAAPIAMACPVLYFAYYFTTLGYGLGIGFAVVNIGMYCLTRWTWAGALAAIVMFTFGIGIYQAVLPLITVIFGFYIIGLLVNGTNTTFVTLCKRSLVFATVLAIAFVCYELIKRWSLHYVNVPYAAQYLSEFNHFQLSSDYMLPTLQKTWLAAWHYYSGGRIYYLYNLWSLKLLFCLSLFFTCVKILQSPAKLYLRLLGLLTVLVVLATPMAMLVMNAGDMPPRTMLGVAYVLAGLVFFAASVNSKIVRTVIGVLAITCFYKFTLVNNRYSLANHMTWQADREFSVMLMQRMGEVWHKLPPKDIYSKYPMELVGVRELLPTPFIPHRDVIGTSFYYWSAGDLQRVTDLLLTMGITDYKPATQQQRLSVVEQAQAMPSWPDAGSVDVINGIIVVKVGPYNPHQIVSMCQPPEDKNSFCVKTVPGLIL
ncbi:MAG TPA: glucosyltransferase domain-containing protein [Pseudomonadales bacterium]|nr:glucosyltransferase domain-containing protein [Pseudomonadales bacterium]